DGPLPPLQAMFERMESREELRESTFSKGSGYLLYKIVDTNVDAAFPMLRKMGNKLDQLEEDIFEGRSSEIVRDLSNAKQEIINFRRIVRPQRAVLRDLERTKQRYLAEELEIYFDDISDAAERIWDTLENYKEGAEAVTRRSRLRPRPRGCSSASIPRSVRPSDTIVAPGETPAGTEGSFPGSAARNGRSACAKSSRNGRQRRASPAGAGDERGDE